MSQGCCGGQSNSNGGDQEMMPKMAKKMMNKMQGGDFNPQEMCQKMMSSIETTTKLAGFATPEVQMLFEEWTVEVEREIVVKIEEKEEFDLTKIAEELKISEDSLRYFISKLIRDQKLKVTDLEVL